MFSKSIHSLLKVATGYRELFVPGILKLKCMWERRACLYDVITKQLGEGRSMLGVKWPHKTGREIKSEIRFTQSLY